MSNNQENYGIDRSRKYSKKEIQKLIGIKKIKTVRESLNLAGLSTTQRSYTESQLLDREFVNIRRLFDKASLTIAVPYYSQENCLAQTISLAEYLLASS